jgi:hypothetical protein
MRLPPVRFAVVGIVLVAAVLIAISDRYSRWSQARAARSEVVQIAAREYRKQFGWPAPSFRALPSGQVAHLSARWDHARQGYLVGFGHQHLFDSGPLYYRFKSLFRSVPYDSGHTTTEFFLVRRDGSCEYAGLIEGGNY